MPSIELNSVNPSGWSPVAAVTSPVYELTNADTATGPGRARSGRTMAPPSPIGPGFTAVNDNDDAPFVVGGRMGGVDNEEVLIVGSNDDVFVRSTAGGTLTVTPAPFPGGTVQAIATDPEELAALLRCRLRSVSGKPPTPEAAGPIITRNLENVNYPAAVPRSMSATSGRTSIVVGGNLRRLASHGGFPRRHMDAVRRQSAQRTGQRSRVQQPRQRRRLAGRYRSAAAPGLIENASIVVEDLGVLNICGDEDSVNQDDVIRLVRNAMNPLILDVFLNSLAPVFSIPLAVLSQINVFGQGGNDNLIVDSSNGLINVPDGIRYDGDGICPDLRDWE